MRKLRLRLLHTLYNREPAMTTKHTLTTALLASAFVACVTSAQAECLGIDRKALPGSLAS